MTHKLGVRSAIAKCFMDALAFNRALASTERLFVEQAKLVDAESLKQAQDISRVTTVATAEAYDSLRSHKLAGRQRVETDEILVTLHDLQKHGLRPCVAEALRRLTR